MAFRRLGALALAPTTSAGQSSVVSTISPSGPLRQLAMRSGLVTLGSSRGVTQLGARARAPRMGLPEAPRRRFQLGGPSTELLEQSGPALRPAPEPRISVACLTFPFAGICSPHPMRRLQNSFEAPRSKSMDVSTRKPADLPFREWPGHTDGPGHHGGSLENQVPNSNIKIRPLAGCAGIWFTECGSALKSNLVLATYTVDRRMNAKCSQLVWVNRQYHDRIAFPVRSFVHPASLAGRHS